MILIARPWPAGLGLAVTGRRNFPVIVKSLNDTVPDETGATAPVPSVAKPDNDNPKSDTLPVVNPAIVTLSKDKLPLNPKIETSPFLDAELALAFALPEKVVPWLNTKSVCAESTPSGFAKNPIPSLPVTIVFDTVKPEKLGFAVAIRIPLPRLFEIVEFEITTSDTTVALKPIPEPPLPSTTRSLKVRFETAETLF